MLDDIRAELGKDAVEFLREAECLGRVCAVLLECRAAGHEPNIMEAVSLAGAEDRVATLIRRRHPMEFSIDDLERIIDHALPAMTPLTAKRVARNNRRAYDADDTIFCADDDTDGAAAS